MNLTLYNAHYRVHYLEKRFDWNPMRFASIENSLSAVRIEQNIVYVAIWNAIHVIRKKLQILDLEIILQSLMKVAVISYILWSAKCSIFPLLCWSQMVLSYFI